MVAIDDIKFLNGSLSAGKVLTDYIIIIIIIIGRLPLLSPLRGYCRGAHLLYVVLGASLKCTVYSDGPGIFHLRWGRFPANRLMF